MRRAVRRHVWRDRRLSGRDGRVLPPRNPGGDLRGVRVNVDMSGGERETLDRRRGVRGFRVFSLPTITRSMSNCTKEHSACPRRR